MSAAFSLTFIKQISGLTAKLFGQEIDAFTTFTITRPSIHAM